MTSTASSLTPSAPPRRLRTGRRGPFRVLPGYRLTLGYTIAYVSLMVLLPLSAVFWHALHLSLPEIWKTISSPRVLASLRLSFGTAAAAAATNALFGLFIAWALTRYRFPGRWLFDAMIDLPLALPTAVAGISLAALCSPHGWIGAPLAPFGIRIAYTPLGITIALAFVSLPFVVRTVQPVLSDLDQEVERAAETLGASPFQTFRWVVLPSIWPTLLTGAALGFSRALGEYGSVVFIAGNIPRVSEIAPVMIMSKLDQFQISQATAIALVMLLASFLLMFAINALQLYSHRRRQR